MCAARISVPVTYSLLVVSVGEQLNKEDIYVYYQPKW